ncbi:MAG: 30S ribosomal protein S9 [Moorea sp. SIO4E2]|uniref:30S ribosomal protein S9 n=1 Tax=Moorena sp. SIO4E2 TaxID=2607826 RepID=UPI0013B77A11|nr:30S ribosomal protein S9 [Moorena sp. SIO4E2]NEQ11789.1 30S ribosomal protein S9 [Moorena sp. SIO4E2]
MNTKPNFIFKKENNSVGKRKCSTARIFLSDGTGKIIINKLSAETYFQFRENYISTIKAPLEKLKVLNQYDIIILVKGGGLTGQADAIRSGIANLLARKISSNRSILKKAGYLTRDTRIKERKKYGLLKARKAPQFSKR